MQLKWKQQSSWTMERLLDVVAMVMTTTITTRTNGLKRNEHLRTRVLYYTLSRRCVCVLANWKLCISSNFLQIEKVAWSPLLNRSVRFLRTKTMCTGARARAQTLTFNLYNNKVCNLLCEQRAKKNCVRINFQLSKQKKKNILSIETIWNELKRQKAVHVEMVEAIVPRWRLITTSRKMF